MTIQIAQETDFRTTRTQLPSLQACRGIGCVLVVFCHLGSTFKFAKYLGSAFFADIFENRWGMGAVELFFVLSGFLLVHVHENDFDRPARLGSYFYKRFVRVYLGYWFVLLPVAVVYFLVPSFGTGVERDPWFVFTSYLLLPPPGGNRVLAVSWSLSHEVFFYFMFALLILNRRIGWLAIAALVTIAYLNPQPFGPVYPVDFLLSKYFYRFLAGMVVALTLRRIQVPFARSTAAIGLMVMLTGTWFAVHHGMDSEMLAWFHTLGSMLLIAGLVQSEKNKSIRTPSWLNELGNASYMIYLVHFPILSAEVKLAKVTHLLTTVPETVLFVVISFTSVMAGVVLHRYLEAPMLRWISHREPRSMARKSVPDTLSLNRHLPLADKVAA